MEKRQYRSRYKTVEGRTFKTCPSCTRKQGVEFYRPIEKFGSRNMGDGVIIDQSYCVECRAEAARKGA